MRGAGPVRANIGDAGYHSVSKRGERTVFDELSVVELQMLLGDSLGGDILYSFD